MQQKRTFESVGQESGQTAEVFLNLTFLGIATDSLLPVVFNIDESSIESVVASFDQIFPEDVALQLIRSNPQIFELKGELPEQFDAYFKRLTQAAPAIIAYANQGRLNADDFSSPKALEETIERAYRGQYNP